MNARTQDQPQSTLTDFIVTIATGMKRTTLPWLTSLLLGAILVRAGFQVSQWITVARREEEYRQMYYPLRKTGENAHLFSKNLPVFVRQTMLFIETWALDAKELSEFGKFRGPWDKSDRRISHAEKQKLFQWAEMREEFLLLLPGDMNREILKTLEKHLFSTRI